MCEGMLHICDIKGPKKIRSVETRLEAMEQQVFKCQGMVERGLNANHMMITEFTSKHKIDANDIGKHLSRLYDRIDQLQAQIYDLQNQNLVWHCEEGYTFIVKAAHPRTVFGAKECTLSYQGDRQGNATFYSFSPAAQVKFDVAAIMSTLPID
ncbi:40S ribosomal protein S5-1 [Hordeum vulgare]|nr:40S ribosomal protein S5-1 [Hordeum vulgare]